MKHTSVSLDQPIELINVTPVNPLISKCQIKVCYVSDEPNRNRSIITKETARGMANSLPGCPIVGFYNEAKGDFEEHNRVIDISNGEFKIKDTTRPYGFVDLNAKVWFQKFMDDDEVEREYMVTEGWLWTGQYPECQRIFEEGNNHSMELDEKTLDATWSKDNKGKPQFFIINEAIISKLCILGEENEPCFEGSQITKVQFSFDDSFKEQLFSMMNELKELLQKGGAKVFSTYAVTVGDALWTALYEHIDSSEYRIDGVFEDEGQKYAVLQSRSDEKYYRLDFSMSESEEFTPAEALTEVADYSVTEAQFSADDVANFEAEYAKKKAEDQGKEGKEDQPKSDDNSEEGNDDDEDDEEKKKKKKEFAEEKCPKCGKPLTECTCKGSDDDDDKKKKYTLEEIPEYVELSDKFSALQADYDALKAEKETLEQQIGGLKEFKLAAERKDKEAMIANFYMLSDEDKADVVANIDTYSLDDIEAKLSVICVRNKVSFGDPADHKDPTTYNLNDHEEDDSVPAWVKAALNTAATLN